MSRKQPKRRAGRVVPVTIAGIFILAIVCGVGFGVATADSSDDLAQAGGFGFDEATQAATLAIAAGSENAASPDTGSSGQVVLTETSARDVSMGLAMIDHREAAEKERAAAEKEAAAKRVAEAKAKQEAKAKEEAESVAAKAAAQGETYVPIDESKLNKYNLPAVDWSVGKKAFITEWSTRIDKYLKGTPLEGYGVTFATAAWENGIDPRWSPAISNTESGNGSHCFLPHNAWGWGNDSWPDWETAINAHVSGLAKGYGYSLTFDAAKKYCPPNCVHWYNNTLGQMGLI